MPIQAGIIAPDFELPDGEATLHKLSDYRGQPVVLYFYPADDTPSCTREACNFRDDYSVYQDAGVAILGVSPDDQQSHAKFSAKYKLPFPLLADTEREVMQRYGVWGKKTLFGREYDGVLRTTFLIDAEGKIAKVFENVKTPKHSAEVLAAIEKL